MAVSFHPIHLPSLPSNPEADTGEVANLPVHGAESGERVLYLICLRGMPVTLCLNFLYLCKDDYHCMYCFRQNGQFGY